MRKRQYPTYILSIGAILLLAYCLIFQPSAIGDIVVALALMVVLFFIDLKFKLPLEAFIFLFIAILLNPIGLFGLYARFVFFDIGYDKVIHLFT